MYAVYLFPSGSAGTARELLEDDLVSRQSVALREPRGMGLDREGLLVILEGEEVALARFEDLAGERAERLRGTEAEEAYAALKREEEDAAEGVGLLFG